MKFLSSKQYARYKTVQAELDELKIQLRECEASRTAWIAARISEVGPGFNILSIPGITQDRITELRAAHAAFIEDKPMMRGSVLIVIDQHPTTLSESDRAAITALLNKPSFGPSRLTEERTL